MMGRDDGAAVQNAEEALLEEAESEVSTLEESSSSEDLLREDPPQEQQRVTGKRRSAIHALVAPLLHFCRQQLELTLSGENASPHLKITSSPIVAASSLLYIPVSLSFFAVGEQPMGTVMGAITVTSLYSDSLDPTSKFWSRLDRFLCTMGGETSTWRTDMLFHAVLHRHCTARQCSVLYLVHFLLHDSYAVAGCRGTPLLALAATRLHIYMLFPPFSFPTYDPAAVLGPVKAIVLASTVSRRVQVIFVCGGSLSLLACSRQSKTQKEFVLRHTLWHVAQCSRL